LLLIAISNVPNKGSCDKIQLFEELTMLGNQIKDDRWLGKPILEIGATQGFLNIPREMFLGYAPMQNIQSHERLNVLINDNLTTKLIGDCALGFLQSSYSINKAYNSQKYPNLEVVASDILSQAPAKRENDIIFDKASAVPLDDYRTWFDEIPGIIPGYNPVDFRKQLEVKSQNLVQGVVNAIKEIIRLLKEAKKTIPARIKWQLWEAEKVLNSVLGGSKQNTTKSAIMPITVGGVADIIASIASIVLSGFLLKGALAGIIETFKWTVTSIVAKILGGTLIADACRHLAGQVLRGVKNLLPTVFNPTGLFAGAYAFLVSYAPYIIIAAVITILIIKQHQRLVGEYLYIIGMRDEKVAAFRYTKLYETKYEEMKQILLDGGEEIRVACGGLTQLMGFAIQDDRVDQVAIAVNFLNDNEVIEGDERNALILPYVSTITDYSF
jgi:uncharacterized membrane protein YgcG